MPMLNVVRFVCSSPEASCEVRECLSKFAAHQLSVPHPGTAVYHFARRDHERRPLEMEFVEVYRDDAVFWKHLDAGPGMQSRVVKMFDEKNRSDREWRVYGGEDATKLRSSMGPMGASFDCQGLAGFIFNEKLKKESISDPRCFALLSARFTAKDAECAAKAKELLEKAAEKASSLPNPVVTFFAGCPSPSAPMEIELISSASCTAISTLTAEIEGLSALCASADVVVYGTGDDESVAAVGRLAAAFPSGAIRLAESEVGYVVHTDIQEVLLP